jgi:hypothetical protein
MKKLLLAAAAPLLITSHGVALAKSTNTCYQRYEFGLKPPV